MISVNVGKFLRIKRHVSQITSLKVAVISDVATERSGVGTYYEDLVAQLRDRVERISLYNPSHSASRAGWKMPGDATQRITFPHVRALYGELDALGPQAVIVATPGPWGIIGVRYAKRRGIPVIIGFHTHFRGLTGLYWGRWRSHLSSALLRFVHHWLFQSSDLVLVNAPGMLEEARALGARAIEVIGTPVARDFIQRPHAPLGSTLSRVLFAGRLAPEKNIEAVIDAASRLPHLQFTIVGDGPMREQIEAAALRFSNLELLRWLTRKQLLEIFDRTDLLVLPSHLESLGSIALEGLARGRNVLVSAQCGLTEWPRLAPALFRMEVNESLAQAIERVARLPHTLRQDKARLGAEGAALMNSQAIDEWLERLNHYGTPINA